MKLKINKEYAAKFTARKEREELQNLKRKYKDVEESSSSSSESEDDYGIALTSEQEKNILRTVAALKSKDPRCYDPNYKFYDDQSDDEDGEDSESEDDDTDGHEATTSKKKKERKEKPMFLKDYERKIITERNGKLSDEDSASESETEDEPKPADFYEQQNLIRKSILEAADQIEGDGLLLHSKVDKTNEKKKKEGFLEWLKGRKDEIDENLAKDLEPLKNMWMDPNLDSKDKFLRDFTLNQNYKGDFDSDLDEDQVLNEADEDEKEYDAEELFATKVNFRFEEPDKEFIKNYPRTIGDSARNKDTRRSEKRKQVKDRKLAEKQKEKEELKRLKNLKKKEILEKLDKLKNVIGNDSIGLNEEELEDDFDPAKHDALMEKLIGEDYYDQDADDDKPKFSREDFDDEEEDWNEWDGTAADDIQQPDLSPEEPQPSTSKENYSSASVDEEIKEPKKKKRSKFTEELEKLRQSFDPKTMTPDEYINEILSRMDYEDKIGDVAFRFSYRNVIPCDYGLTVDEVMTVPDRELNSWVSVKKMTQYRTKEEENMDVRVFKKKAKDINKKLNILPSLRSESSSNMKKESAKKTNQWERSQSGPQKKQKKKGPAKEMYSEEANQFESKKEQNKKRKYKEMKEDNTECKEAQAKPQEEKTEKEIKSPKSKKFKASGSAAVETESSVGNEKTSQDGNTEAKKGDKNKRKKKHKPSVPTMSNTRLEAYGINPKKFKYVIQNKLHQEMKNANEQKSS